MKVFVAEIMGADASITILVPADSAGEARVRLAEQGIAVEGVSLLTAETLEGWAALIRPSAETPSG